MLKDVARLDNCVTVVDACNFDATFYTGDYLSDRFKVDNESDTRTVVHLMIDQIEFSNIIILNKIDMVKPEDAARITKTLKKLNPSAEIYPTNYSNVPLSKILNTHQFNFEDAAKVGPNIDYLLSDWLHSYIRAILTSAPPNFGTAYSAPIFKILVTSAHVGSTQRYLRHPNASSDRN